MKTVEDDLSQRDRELYDQVKTIVDHFDREDRDTRDRQIRVSKQLKYYWEGINNIYWDATAHDYRVLPLEEDYEGDYYEKNVNIFRALIETIIAALSVSVPSIVCTPDDADNPLDVATAKAGNKIAELVSKHNDHVLLWLHALYIFYTEGTLFAYTYTKESEEYGIVKVPQKGMLKIDEQIPYCPNCNAPLEIVGNGGGDDWLNEDIVTCANCGQEVTPAYKDEEREIETIVGTTEEPKTRQCIEVYGLLNVKVPNYARKQEDCPYLIFAYETHYVNVLERYPDLWDKKDKVPKFSTSSTGGGWQLYERWGRTSPQYAGDFPKYNVTVRNVWLRPQTYYILDTNWVERLRKEYPNGIKVVIVNETVADILHESLDKHWTISYNPLADTIHSDPPALLVTAIQDITVEVISLTLQTIEHGIPQTFADPSVLNFNEYGKNRPRPGDIYAAKPPVGGQIGNAFYEVKTATLSAEVLPFLDKMQEAGQFVSGALPSLFGGSAPNSSRTAAQYAMSRAQALQRLQTPWKILSFWWKNIFGKVIVAFIENMKDDERFVSKNKDGNFVNIFVNKIDAQNGKIGSVELEASEQLPATWAQKRDIIMQLLQSSNPLVMAMLADPENLPIIASALGLDDLNLPGELDRQKQLEEIRDLLASDPLDEMTPSVSIDETDNHEVEADIARTWLISDAGRQARIDNESGYRNVLLHLMQHRQAHQMMMQPPQMPNAAQQMGLPTNKLGKTQPMMEKTRGTTATVQ